MSENVVSGFNENLTKIIRELKEENKIAEIDLVWLFSYTLKKYSMGRYLNNQENISNLLRKIATQLLIQKHGIGNLTMALPLWGSVKVTIIDYFNKLIKKNKELFPTLSNSLSNIVRRETLDLIVEFTTNKLKQIDLVSFVSNLNELSVQVESFYKIPIKETEYLKNINFLKNSYPKPGDFYFYKNEQYFEIDRLCIGTLNYLANHILNKEYKVKKFQVQITYKLTSSPVNKLFNPTLTAKMDHTFDFWEIGDELVKLGLGYWYPYFTTKNQDKKAINVNFIIPSFVFNIINEIRDSLPQIENFQERLESFDYTKRTSGITLDFEISHDQIKDFIAANPDKLKKDLRLIGKEYKTGEVGDIDILFQTENGDFLVIEVKKETPRYEPVGQILNYIGWVKKNLGEKGKIVRGIIVCKNVHPQLKSAFSEANNPYIQVWLYEKQEEGFKFEKNLEIEGKLCPFCGNFCSPHAKFCPKCGDPF